MKCYLSILVAFLVMINVALGAVGDVSVSDTSAYLQPDQSLTGTASMGAPAQMLLMCPIKAAHQSRMVTFNLSRTIILCIAQQAYVSPQGSDLAYSAPQISGPMQDQLTAEVLGFSPPEAESFAPDESLNFVSSSSPGKMMGGAKGAAAQTAQAGSSYWYYPNQINSANRFYVQTSQGLNTVAGCSYGGYLPLFADIKSSGNFFVYEWYPGESAPSVRSWGWTETGYKKGWFSGDVPGWHILCYNCGIWSNYIYIYVYPEAIPSPSPGYTNNPIYQSNPGYTANPIYASNSGYTGSPIQASNPSYIGNPSTIAQATMIAGAPTPPDPDSERLVMPDNNLYRPITGQATDGTFYNYPAQQTTGSIPVQAVYPGQSATRVP